MNISHSYWNQTDNSSETELVPQVFFSSQKATYFTPFNFSTLVITSVSKKGIYVNSGSRNMNTLNQIKIIQRTAHK